MRRAEGSIPVVAVASKIRLTAIHPRLVGHATARNAPPLVCTAIGTVTLRAWARSHVPVIIVVHHASKRLM